MGSALFCQMSTGLSPAHRSFHFPVPSNIRFDPSPHMFDVVLIDYEMTAWQQDGGWQRQRQQQQQDGRLGAGGVSWAPAGASSNHGSGLEGSAGGAGELCPAGGARGVMISRAGGGECRRCFFCPGSTS